MVNVLCNCLRICSSLKQCCLPRSVRPFCNVPLPASRSCAPGAVTAENQYECLSRAVTPLWEMPYEEQLKVKWKWTSDSMYKFAKKFRQQGKGKSAGRLSYRVLTAKPSPVVDAYRNKDEFNIQMGIDGNPKTVGFFVGSPADGTVVCVRPTHLINMRESHKEVALAYEEYIRSSPLPACLNLSDGGHWRSLVVRSNEAGQLMAVAVFNPQNLEQTRLEEEGSKLCDFFLHGAGARCNLHSLFFQPCRHTRCTADQAPYTLLFGDSHLIETLGDYKFRISPDSFFQVNTAAAMVLYDTVLKSARVTRLSTLLDVCSGTGTVSILASPRVRGAVGVEAVYSAVTDARFNAQANYVNNVEFIPGLAEKKIPKIISELEMASDIVAIVNPGRSGLHSRVVKALCKCQQIRRVVYVSCKADSPNAVSNFIALCHEGRFSLESVVPIDLFPHTMHTELVMAFSR